jgi:hypothetical protein
MICLFKAYQWTLPAVFRMVLTLSTLHFLCIDKILDQAECKRGAVRPRHFVQEKKCKGARLFAVACLLHTAFGSLPTVTLDMDVWICALWRLLVKAKRVRKSIRSTPRRQKERERCPYSPCVARQHVPSRVRVCSDRQWSPNSTRQPG